MIGTYTVSTWEDMRDSILPTLREQDISALYALGADALYAFSNGQTGIWWLVEHPAQADLLVATKATIRERILTRDDIVNWAMKGNREDPACEELRALPLLELLRRGLVSDAAAVERVPSAALLPAGILTGNEPGLERLGDEHDTWFRPVTAWAAENPEIREQLGADFFLFDAWIIGARDVPTSIVVESQEQKDRLDSMNMALIAEGCAPFPAWGPADFDRYLGDHQIIFGAEAKARFATAVQRVIVNAEHQGERIATQRLALHEHVVPLMGKALLSMMTAYELLGKSLFRCSDDELSKIQVAVGQLLLAAGSATPFRRADLPKPPATPGDVDQSGGNYL